MWKLIVDLRRFWTGLGLAAVPFIGIYWTYFFEGFPVGRGPTASEAEIVAGKELFEHEWTPNDPLAHGDGLGPVFNARSCAACHFQGGLGGGGGQMHNVVTFEVLPRPGDSSFHTGSLHAFSVDPANQESRELLKEIYGTVPARIAPPSQQSCNVPTRVPEFDPVHTESLQPIALFGAGWIDLISEKAITANRRKRLAQQFSREMNAEFEHIPVGRVRTLPDGSVGRFGWKAQFADLQGFVAAACSSELGLGTPDAEQAAPLFAPNLTSAPDLDKKQFRALVSFVKTLPRPEEIVPDDTAERDAAAKGKQLFGAVGCAVCHVSNMGGVKGVYSDFLLYTLNDPIPGGADGYHGDPPPDLKLPSRPEADPKPSEWRTPPLWGVADSGPYMHDGSAATLRDAIGRHRGDARLAFDAYYKLAQDDQAALIAFLSTLKAPRNATPLKDPTITDLTKK